jgi:alpha-L-rhamnosidase
MPVRFDTQKRFYEFLRFPVIFLVLFSACHFSRKDDSFRVESTDLSSAFWIGAGADTLEHDARFYEDNPAPLFRKEFPVENKVHSATLYITAAGYYRASLNGERIGKNYLDPAWTDFSKRIYYTRYDLTADIRQGANCLGVTLGNGFYNPLPLRMWGHLNLRESLPAGNPVFIASLKIVYRDGNTEEIITDHSWKFSFGPIKKNNVYLGEWYDAGDEMDGWESAGFNDSEWDHAIQQEGPGGVLQESFFPAIRITDRITPVSITPVADGACLVDMGVNFTGLYRIHLTGEPGDTISFRFGERIYDKGELNPMTAVAGQIKQAGTGGPGAPAIAWQTDAYVFGDRPDVWYSPEFTFHTYRYMEISGLKEQPGIEDIEGIVLHTNVTDRNRFSCASDLVNSIQEAVWRTFLSNLISVQSDCPAREKFGYGGDLNATSEAFIYNFDMRDFYRKTIYDWVDAINDSVFIDTAPFVGIRYCGLSWESAFLITQYNLYLYYNDTAIVKELYELDLQWMEKAARIHPAGIVDKGLSDHESLEPVPVELTGTSHYLQCAGIMATFASCMGDTENKDKYEKLAHKLRTLILERFWNKPVPGPINRQTLFATLLCHDIIPDDEVPAAVDSLLMSVSSAPAGHFTTGIFGTKYILEALSRTGNDNVVYEIVNSTDFPGWGYMIDRGATTIWETWKESDNIYSNCHPMFGSISEWLFRWLGGIQPDPDHPGFEKFKINPLLPEALSGVRCSYHSPCGEIVSNWSKYGNDKNVFEIKVPEGSVANVTLPVTEEQKVIVREIGSDVSCPAAGDGKHRGSFELIPGEYIITVLSTN